MTKNFVTPTKYVITDKGPLDNQPPGTDVTDRYPASLLVRLIDEGYVAEDKPKAKRKKQTAPDEPADDQPADDQPADEDGD